MATPEAGSVPEATPPPRTGSVDELLDTCAICLGRMPREEKQEQVASEAEALASCQLLWRCNLLIFPLHTVPNAGSGDGF